MDKKLLLIDANAVIHRAFHALPPLTTKKGELVNAVYGFTTTLLKALKDFGVTHVAATFDLAAPTFRHKKYEAYKATRVKAPQELYDQIDRVKDVLKAFNIPIYSSLGYEADDCLATLTDQAVRQNFEVMIVTGDLDTLQLVSPKVTVKAMRRGLSDFEDFGPERIKEKYGLTPNQTIDYKALKGDPSDNISGVAGIGEKQAQTLIQQFGTLEKLYQSLDQTPLPTRQKKILAKGKKSAFFSKELVILNYQVPIQFDQEKCRVDNYQQGEIAKLFQELEFNSLLNRLPSSRPNQPKPSLQGQLF